MLAHYFLLIRGNVLSIFGILETDTVLNFKFNAIGLGYVFFPNEMAWRIQRYNMRNYP